MQQDQQSLILVQCNGEWFGAPGELQENFRRHGFAIKPANHRSEIEAVQAIDIAKSGAGLSRKIAALGKGNEEGSKSGVERRRQTIQGSTN